MKNYYHILELPESASHAEIKRNTLRKGKQLHPKSKVDSNINTSKDFINVIEAFQVLGDEKSKKIYDQLLNDNSHPEVRNKQINYIQVIAFNGRKSGEHYANSKYRTFKNDHKVVRWWDITSIIQDLIPVF